MGQMYTADNLPLQKSSAEFNHQGRKERESFGTDTSAQSSLVELRHQGAACDPLTVFICVAFIMLSKSKRKLVIVKITVSDIKWTKLPVFK